MKFIEIPPTVEDFKSQIYTFISQLKIPSYGEGYLEQYMDMVPEYFEDLTRCGKNLNTLYADFIDKIDASDQEDKILLDNIRSANKLVMRNEVKNALSNYKKEYHNLSFLKMFLTTLVVDKSNNKSFFKEIINS